MLRNKNSTLLMADSYKYSHYLAYPDLTIMVNSYIEARGSDDPDMKKVLFFGLQAFLKEYLSVPFTQDDIDEAEAVISAHGEPFNRAGFEYILREHGGYFPVEIEAIPEGSVVPLRTALVQVRNTDPDCAWVTSFVETMLLRAVWYPTTVATYSWTIKQLLKEYAERSGSVDSVDFKLHDFGGRGVSSEESAQLGGMAHIVNFMGTDTVAGLVAARRYYDAEMPAFSIPAAEHSIAVIWAGQK